jgi:nucleotide-binding universal stress UspA family protein
MHLPLASQRGEFMSIVCGTDFSERSRYAADVAAHFAARTNARLHLVHAFDTGSAALNGEAENHEFVRLQDALDHEAELLRRTGIEVQTHLRAGAPDQVLLDVSSEQLATTVFVAALGTRRDAEWRVGTHADRLAQRSHIPVFVVRESDPILSWIRQERPLRVLIGADLSLSAERAMKWVDGLRSLGPCEIDVIDLYWPPAEFKRLGLSGVRDFAGPHPEVEQALRRDLSECISRSLPAAPVDVRLEPHIGSVGARIAALADDEAADLIVVGSHDRNAVERVLAGSVSHVVLHRANASVVCVPEPDGAATRPYPELASIVVPTDFSPSGNAAVDLAYATIAPGGTVHLVHVTNGRSHSPLAPHDIFPRAEAAAEDEPAQRVVQRMLAELVPLGQNGRVVSQLHVLESNHVAEAICQAAERLGASAICLGTQGRSKAAKALLGSVSSAVLNGTRRPVIFAGNPLE